MYIPYRGYVLPVSVENCTNLTVANAPVMKTNYSLDYLHFGRPDTVPYPFRISTFSYSMIGILCLLFLGTILSLILPDRDVKAKRALTFYGRDLPVRERVQVRVYDKQEYNRARHDSE